MTRTVELEIVPVCREYGVGIIPYSPLSGGLLAGTLRSGPGGRRADRSTLPTETANRLDEYEALCGRIGEEPQNVALAWLLHNPVVTAPIIGPRTVEQLESAAKAVEIVLDSETLAELDRIFPGPGNQAPEAYAW